MLIFGLTNHALLIAVLSKTQYGKHTVSFLGGQNRLVEHYKELNVSVKAFLFLPYLCCPSVQSLSFHSGLISITFGRF